MRDAIIFLLIFGSIPFIFKRPAVGVLVYAVISLMNPHRMTYGAAYSFPFAAVIFGATFLSLLVSKEPKKFPISSFTLMFVILFIWMTFTSVIALEPTLTWIEWNRVMKTFLMITITIMALRTQEDVKALAWTVGLSMGFWGFKGGIFTILSGGTSHVLGPADSYISDNNTLALSQIVIIPILAYMTMSAQHKWLRRACGMLVFLTVCAAIGSYSRGALLGGGAMLAFLWLKSQQKVKVGIIVLMVLPLVYLLMPEQWFGRMGTIEDYEEDQSAMGRINSWYFAINVANDTLTGGGFRVFSRRMFEIYAPDPQTYHVAHSIYFQVLGEHGYLGLTMFLLMLFFAWRTGSRVIAFCKDKEDLKWARNLAAMSQVSMIGYMVGGAFLTLAYYDLPYYIYAIMVLLEKVLIRMPPTGELPRLWGYEKKKTPMRNPNRQAGPPPMPAPAPTPATGPGPNAKST